jgi:Zn-dependent peptidase ImmA (M78 family)
MSREMTASSQSTQSHLYPLFIGIKKRVNNILDQYNNDKNFLEDVSVDIEAIAYNNGIKGIYSVPPFLIQYDHSHLFKDDIILLNKDDKSEHRFSIAHEIAHFILGRGKNNQVIARSEIRPITENLEESFLSSSAFSEITKFSSRVISDFVSEIIDKPVTSKNASKLIMKTANKFFDEKIKPFYEGLKDITSPYPLTEDMLKPLKDEIQQYIFEIVLKVCEEEIADYFAANLLVPTERFILWEDETDETIADKFKVSVKCIQKRRGEIERELDFMIPKNQSSDTEIEELEIASIDELDSLLEANNIHVDGGF